MAGLFKKKRREQAAITVDAPHPLPISFSTMRFRVYVAGALAPLTCWRAQGTGWKGEVNLSFQWFRLTVGWQRLAYKTPVKCR